MLQTANKCVCLTFNKYQAERRERVAYLRMSTVIILFCNEVAYFWFNCDNYMNYTTLPPSLLYMYQSSGYSPCQDVGCHCQPYAERGQQAAGALVYRSHTHHHGEEQSHHHLCHRGWANLVFLPHRIERCPGAVKVVHLWTDDLGDRQEGEHDCWCWVKTNKSVSPKDINFSGIKNLIFRLTCIFEILHWGLSRCRRP